MQCAPDPLYDIDPRTGASIEVFYADRELETSAGAALVGSGARADAAFRQTACLSARLLRATQRIETQ